MIKKLIKSNKGFTLIELLIVIVIIGILAGVLIAIIDPAAQQNRAKDATVQATMNKIALATQGYNSAYGNYPDGPSFLGGIDGVTATSGCDDTDLSDGVVCIFSVDSFGLPGGECGTGTARYYGDGDTVTGTDCRFGYVVANNGTDFDLFAKSYGDIDSVFRYDSEDSAVHICLGTAGTINCTNPVGD